MLIDSRRRGGFGAGLSDCSAIAAHYSPMISMNVVTFGMESHADADAQCCPICTGSWLTRSPMVFGWRICRRGWMRCRTGGQRWRRRLRRPNGRPQPLGCIRTWRCCIGRGCLRFARRWLQMAVLMSARPSAGLIAAVRVHADSVGLEGELSRMLSLAATGDSAPEAAVPAMFICSAKDDLWTGFGLWRTHLHA